MKTTLKAAVVALAIMGFIFAVWIFLIQDNGKTTKNDKRTSRIAEANADIAVGQPKKADTNEVVRELTTAEKLLQGKDTNKWIVVKDPRTGKEYLSRLFKPGLKDRKPPLYKYSSLNELDAIMFKDYGDRLPGITIDDRFVRNFQEAILDKIEINPDDDDETAERKRAMVETIADLKAEIKAGGDLKQIVSDALRERRNVAALKEQMITERRNMRESGASEEEVADFENACNKILEEKGASPMITREILRQRIEERKALDAQKGMMK